jgi:hypothetical protein
MLFKFSLQRHTMRASGCFLIVCVSMFLIIAQPVASIGDVNNDGVVNTADLLIIIGDLGKTSGFNPNSDVKADGVINLYDLVVIGQNWGTTTPSSPTILFQSDWSTATGTADAALRDTSKAVPWPNVIANNKLTVIPSTGYGFPTTNILRVRHTAGAQGSAEVYGTNIWAQPAIGESVAFRLYLRNEIADSEGDKSANLNSHHPVESNFGNLSWEWLLTSRADGTFPIRFNTPNGGSGHWVLSQWPEDYLNKFQTYRLEWKFNRTAVNKYSLDIRIYNQSGALIYDKNSIYSGSSANPLATAGLDENLTDANMLGWVVGTNGGGWTFISDQYTYYGGAAVCLNDWCGPYVSSDTTAPTLSNGTPSGSLAAGTTNATLSVTTNEAATCKFSTTAGTSYAAMSNAFTTTGNTTHNVTITGLTNGQTYNRYVKCQDAAGNNNTADYTITFNVLSAVSGQFESICPGGSNPRSDIVFCVNFENYSSASCVTGKEAACLTANNAGTSNTLGWAVKAGDAAIGNGAFESKLPPGSDGSGYAIAGIPGLTNASLRYYVKFKNGYMQSSYGTGDHSPGLQGICGTVFPDFKYATGGAFFQYESSSCAGLAGANYGLPNNVLNNFTFQNNRWYLIEIQANMNTITTGTGGHDGNGIFRAYIDGYKVAEYTDMNFRGTTSNQWTAVFTGRDIYQNGAPSWNATKLYDGIAISNTGAYIGPSVNENPRGTPDPLSPYMNIMAYNGMNLRRNAPGCGAFPSLIPGSMTGLQNGDYAAGNGSFSFSTTIVHGAYPDRCSNPVERSLKLDLGVSDAQAAIRMSQSFTPRNNYVTHGWVYLPSTNTYDGLLTLSGYAEQGWWNNCRGAGLGCTVDDFQYLGIGVEGGQWALIDRHSSNFNSLPPVVILAKNGTVTLDTWHEYELVLKSTNTASVAIDGTWIMVDKPIQPWPFLTADSKNNFYGIDSYNGTRPFAAYFDDIDIGSASYWSCVGWDSSSCPFP